MCELQLVIEMFLGGRAAPRVELNLGETGQRTNMSGVKHWLILEICVE